MRMSSWVNEDLVSERVYSAPIRSGGVSWPRAETCVWSEFAATFFMLSGALKDTANICVRHLKDVQLAIALCKIGEGGEDGPILRELLAKTVVPMAFEAGDRWLLSWCLQVLRRGELIREAILVSLSLVEEVQGLTRMFSWLASAGTVRSTRSQAGNYRLDGVLSRTAPTGSASR